MKIQDLFTDVHSCLSLLTYKLPFSYLQNLQSTRRNNIAPVVDLKRAADNTEGPLKFNMQTGRVNTNLFQVLFLFCSLTSLTKFPEFFSLYLS